MQDTTLYLLFQRRLSWHTSDHHAHECHKSGRSLRLPNPQSLGSCQIPQHSNDLLLILSNWPHVIAEMDLSDILYDIHAVQISLDYVIREGEDLT